MRERQRLSATQPALTIEHNRNKLAFVEFADGAPSNGEVTVEREQRNGDKIRDALRALLSDIEGMYAGADFFEPHGQAEEFFGPFAVGKLGGEQIDAEISVSWPNLAISMRNAKNALRNADSTDAVSDRG